LTERQIAQPSGPRYAADMKSARLSQRSRRRASRPGMGARS
jgi:hypothetical protein